MANTAFPNLADLRSGLTAGHALAGIDHRVAVNSHDSVGTAFTIKDRGVKVHVGVEYGPKAGANPTDPTHEVSQPVTAITLTAETTPATPGEPVRLSPIIITRLNKLLSGERMMIQDNWRTGTHRLKVGDHGPADFVHGQPLRVEKDASGGWKPPARVTISGGFAASPVVTPEAPKVAPVGATVEAPITTHGSSAGQSPKPEPPKVVMSAKNRRKWDTARNVQRTFPEQFVVCFTGPTGTSKSKGVERLAWEEGVDFVKFDCAGLTEPMDWFGTMVPTEGGSIRFEPSDLLTALTAPGERVLLLDEANRALGRAITALLPVLDASGTVTVPQLGKAVRLNMNVQVVLTMNIGSKYIYTDPLDPAFADRVGEWIEMGYLSPKGESRLLMSRVKGLSKRDADNLAVFAKRTRVSANGGAKHPPVSTRQLLNIAKKIATGALPKEAVEGSTTLSLSAEGAGRSERSAMAVHVNGIAWDQEAELTELTSSDIDNEEDETAEGGVR